MVNGARSMPLNSAQAAIACNRPMERMTQSQYKLLFSHFAHAALHTTVHDERYSVFLNIN